MAKIPYLVRRKNVFYFRLRIPAEYQEALKAREIIQSLKTEKLAEAIPLALQLAAHYKSSIQDLKNGKAIHEFTRLNSNQTAQYVSAENTFARPATHTKSTAPLLSVVADDFLKRYGPSNKSMLGKLTGTLAILVELVSDKPVNQILQADLNNFFDEVQKLPVRRDSKKFAGMNIKQIIIANAGEPCIAEKTFIGTYRACISVFIQWATVHYKDQGFPLLSVQGAIYRGIRAAGINKQRAMKLEELQRLFSHSKMKAYSSDAKTAHYCWLPLVGLFTGCRINEVCQLNPFTDIVQDSETGIHYFHFTDEGESVDGIDKSIKTKSSKRIVPIHLKLLELGFLDYVEMVRQGNYKIIFPEWKPRNGKASANATKWFSRYLEETGLKDETVGSRLCGFHSFRHTFITHGMENKIQGLFAITGHETEAVDGFGKVSAVAKGYWTRGVTDNILEKQATIEKFDFGLSFYRPTV
ncbi:MAG: DUF6538 domain-containing protein [Methylobacter sp.]